MSDSAVSLLHALRSTLATRRKTTGVVAVSGGADSIALLHAIIQLAPEFDVHVTAATFDHGLRGAASFDDAIFTAQTAGRWGVPCAVGRGQVDPAKPGVEERARDARYAFLAECAADIHADWVATAHHADDQAETVLMNLIRGAGTHGLGAMRVESRVPGHPLLPLLRPFLMLRKADLEAYCRHNDVSFRDDSSNRDTGHRRNWLRMNVIPLLEEANPAVVLSLARLAQLSADDDAVLSSWVDAWCDTHVTGRPDRLWMRRAPLAQLNVGLQRRVIVDVLCRVAPDAEPTFDHVSSVLDVLSQPEGGSVPVPGGVSVEVDGEYVSTFTADRAWSPPRDGFWLDAGFTQRLDEMIEPPYGWTVVRTEIEREPNALTFALEVGGSDVVLRTRRPGDRVALPGGGGHQKLKDWMINTKVPRMIRDNLPIVEVDGQIAALWDGTTWHVFAFDRAAPAPHHSFWVFVAQHGAALP